MADFDPDAYLAKGGSGFDPDAYLAKGEATKARPAGPAPSIIEKVGMGLADPIHGGAQLLIHVLPDSVVDAGNRVNNWLADKTGLVARLPERNVSSIVTGQPTGVDALVASREQDYQARRDAAGDTGFDWWRTAGNVVSPANKLIPVPAAVSLGGRVAAGAATGAGSAALAPVAGGNYADAKQNQILAGAGFGAVVPLAAAGVSRVISPKASTNPEIAKLRAEGVTPTAGQLAGGAAKRTEEALSSVPLVGQFVRNAQGRAVESVNRAAVNRALKPIGKELPEGMVGNDAIEFAQRELGKRYDDLLPKLTVQADKRFADDIGNLSSMVRNGSIDPKYASAFDRFVRDNVLSKFKGRNALTGQTIKDIESDLGQRAARLKQSQDPDARLMADALDEVQSNLRGLLERSNPAKAEELKKINAGYANFKRVQRAASSVAAEDGVFSPAQLHNAVKAMDKSKDKAAFARGDALMQDLSGSAKKVIGNKLPDSGTAERGLTVGMFLDPRSYALGATAPLLYSEPGQRLLSVLMASRPQGAEPVANALRNASPTLGLLGGQVGVNLLR